MKIVTANSLQDGAVVYLSDDDHWAQQLSNAAHFEDSDAENVLVAAQSRIEEITDAYLVSVSHAGEITGRETLRETIRKAGPTVRRDLGQQSEQCA